LILFGLTSLLSSCVLSGNSLTSSAPASDRPSSATSSSFQSSSSDISSSEVSSTISSSSISSGRPSVAFDKSSIRIAPLNYVNQSGPAPIYDLKKYEDGSYGASTLRSIAKDQECLTYQEVAEYYSIYQSWPKNYKSSTDEALAYGKNGRVVSTYYSGSHHTYDYTVALGTFNLPSGGSYYEFDIDLTGSYNTGSYISRGAGRVVAIVDGITDYGNEPVCYFTEDHYADFIEYYNYDGGWSPLFKGVYNKSGSYENTPTSSISRPTPTSVSYVVA
jgi:guanyl-specific ribonuclease Sa